MTGITSKNIYSIYQSWDKIDELAEKAGYKYLAMKGWNRKPKWHATITRVDIDDDDTFSIDFEGGCGCCPPSTYGMEFLPLSALEDIDSFLVEAKLRGDFDND